MLGILSNTNDIIISAPKRVLKLAGNLIQLAICDAYDPNVVHLGYPLSMWFLCEDSDVTPGASILINHIIALQLICEVLLLLLLLLSLLLLLLLLLLMLLLLLWEEQWDLLVVCWGSDMHLPWFWGLVLIEMRSHCACGGTCRWRGSRWWTMCVWLTSWGVATHSFWSLGYYKIDPRLCCWGWQLWWGQLPDNSIRMCPLLVVQCCSYQAWDMGSILFVVPFVVLYICNWGASIGGESDVVKWGPCDGIFGVRHSHIQALRCSAGGSRNYIWVWCLSIVWLYSLGWPHN